jgi:hypothetical protein
VHAPIPTVSTRGLAGEVGVLLDLGWRGIELAELLDGDGVLLGLHEELLGLQL